jgi:Arc/MetJ family transcription regulator
MHMRTTLNIDEALLKLAARLTGVSEKTALVRMGLEALVEREASFRLAELGGSDPEAEAGRRRRSEDDQ